MESKVFKKNFVYLDEENVLCYDDNFTKGYNHGNQLAANLLDFNKFEAKSLLKSIIYDNFVLLSSETVSDVLIKTSWLYRISQSYRYYHLNNNKKKEGCVFTCDNFHFFLINLTVITNKNEFICSNDDLKIKNFCWIENVFKRGLIFEKDKIEVLNFLKGFTVEINTNAIINGRRFSSRGKEYRQLEPSSNNSPNFNLLQLKGNWFETKNYSSWFKFNKNLFKTYKELLHTGEEFRSHFTYDYKMPLDLYGQFNFFFTINNMDSLINNKLYSSVTMRKTIDFTNQRLNYMLRTNNTEGIRNLSIIQMKDEPAKKSFVHNMIFISEKLVHSSPVLILPIFANETWSIIKGIKPDFKGSNKVFEDKSYEGYYETDKSKATDLIMIDMERNRLTSNVTNPEGWGFL
jgi:hypothetical protein